MAKKRKNRGNFRRPVVAAARRYLKAYEKMTPERKRDEVVQVRVVEARALVGMADRKAEAARAAKKPVKKEALSKKKGRGSFKKVSAKQARKYLSVVSAQHAASTLQKFPFKHRVREAIVLLGNDEAQKLITNGQLRRQAAEARKIALEKRKKEAVAKRKETQAAKIRTAIDAKVAACAKETAKLKERLVALSARRRARARAR